MAQKHEALIFDPKTGKLRMSELNETGRAAYNTLQIEMDSRGFFGGYCAYDLNDRNKLQFFTYPFDPTKTIDVKTIHISCKSDTFEGKNHNYAGVIIYQYNGETDWRTANGTRCKSGYLVIQDTDLEEVKKWKGKTDGVVHGAVYRNAFGEVNTSKVIGEGFAIQGGLFKVNSGVFNNPSGSEYHDERRQMSEISIDCIEKVVKSWKKAGPRSLGCRNFPVKDLLEDD